MTAPQLNQYKRYLRLLRLPAGASHEQVEARFRALAHKHHPDRNLGSVDSTMRFRVLMEARAFLKAQAIPGQAWSRTREGLSWEWSRVPYRDSDRERRRELEAQQRAREERRKAAHWEMIRPASHPATKSKAQNLFQASFARAGSVLRSAASTLRPRSLTPTEKRLAVAAAAFWLAAILVAGRGQVPSIKDWQPGKSVQTRGTPEPRKFKPAPLTKTPADLARLTIQKNWPLVVDCIGAIPKKRAYRGSATYRVKITNGLAREIEIRDDSLHFTLAHSCVTHAIFAMDFGRAHEATLDFRTGFELGDIAVAGR